jgi:hypothetical protein
MTKRNSVLGDLLAILVAALVCAILFAGEARAQLILPDGKLNPACAEPRESPLPVPAKVIPPQADMPKQLKGNGTAAVVEANQNGLAAGWWVARTDRVSFYMYAVTWEYLALNPGLLARLAALAVMPGGDAAMAAAIGVAYDPTLNILDMCNVWSPMVAALNASKPLPLNQLPTLSPYVVTAGSPRPAFAVVNGKRSTTPAGSAVPGQPCDCAALQIIEFNVVRYCASPSITGVTGPAVTACTARKP